MRIRDPECKKFGLWMEKIRIRYNNYLIFAVFGEQSLQY